MEKALTSRRSRMMVAVVLGTALSALGTTAAEAGERQQAGQAVADISRYCTACWRNARLHPDCWTDCTQDVFARLLERVTPDAWDRVLKLESDERREFLRAIDAVKKRTQRARKCSALSDDCVADRRDLQQRYLADDRDALRQAAGNVLSDRQQRVLEMTLEGWSVHEIAGKLKTSPERISDEKYKAIRKLREEIGEMG